MNNSHVSEARRLRLSWDAVLFLMLVAAQLWSSELSVLVPPDRQVDTTLIVYLTRLLAYGPVVAIALLVLAVYVAADLWLTGRRQYTIKLAVVWLAIIGIVILPTVAAIAYRQWNAPYLYVHDGAMQTEEAAQFLLSGQDPYSANYAATPMAQWPFHATGLDANPALYNLAYLPLTFLLAIPFYLPIHALLGWFDLRLVHMAMLVALAMLLLRAGCTRSDKLAGLTVAALNPMSVPFFIEGRNDIAVLFWVAAAIVALQKRRLGWAGVLVACAAATKQTAWFLVPFFALYVWGVVPGARWQDKLSSSVRPLLPALLLFAAIMLPFLAWNPSAFIHGTISYASGLPGGLSYPINSLGFGSLVLALGWVEHITDSFPFSLFQLVFGGL
ncbi:MAG: glycosyltransferase 87 family protein, partial [Chloroflexi bacterium]|nr:glycosyltransferase 87 family protein [Chloroflexota bacterium]